MKKFSSRKFLACVAGVFIGVCMIFGLDQDTIAAVAGAFTSAASVVAYIIAEGKIDAAAAKKAVDKVAEAIDKVNDINE